MESLIDQFVTLSLHIGVLLLFVLVSLGTGVAFRRFLLQEDFNFKSWSDLALSSIFGLMGLQIVSYVCLYYLDASQARWTTAVFALAALCIFSFYWVKNNFPKKVFLFLLSAGFAMSFLYLPFVFEKGPFLASSGSGDHTIYLGAAKLTDAFPTDPELSRPRFRPMLDRVGVSEQIQKLLGFNTEDQVASVLSEKMFDISPARRIIRSGFDAAWWSLPYAILGLSPLIPAMTLYTSLLMTVLVLTGFGVSSCLLVLTGSRFWASLGFLFFASSAGYFGIAFNHYFPQILNVLSALGLSLWVLWRQSQKKMSPLNLLLVCAFTFAAGASYYWPYLPWLGAIAFAAFAVWWIDRKSISSAHRTPAIKITTKLSLSFLFVLLSLPGLIQGFMAAFSFAHRLLFSEAKTLVDVVSLGQPFTNFSEKVGTIFGTFLFSQLEPFTELSFNSLKINDLAPWIVGLSVLILIFNLWLWRKNRNKRFSAPWSFLILIQILFIALTFFSTAYRYTFTKAAYNSFPFLIVIVLGAVFYARNGIQAWPNFSRRLTSFVLFIFLAVWYQSLGDVRIRQIYGFWNSTGRKAIARMISPESQLSGPLSRDRHSFYYPRSNTEFSLLETRLMIRRPVPACQYSLSSYQYIITSSDFENSEYILPNEKSGVYQRFSLQRFQFEHSKNILIPFSPYLEMYKSHIPSRLVLDRESYLEFYLELSEPFEMIVTSQSPELQLQANSIKDPEDQKISWTSEILKNHPALTDFDPSKYYHLIKFTKSSSEMPGKFYVRFESVSAGIFEF